MTEPLFIRQQAGVTSSDERWAWMERLAKEGADQHGCAFFRVSFDQHTLTCLIEGWLTKPADCGKPRFQTEKK